MSFFEAVKVPAVDPQFYARAFTVVAKGGKERGNALLKLLAEEYDSLSRRADRAGIQDSCSIRNVLKTRALAGMLIDEKGELAIGLLQEAIGALQANLYSIGPDRQPDARRQEHILDVLMQLQGNKELARLLRSISKPHAHRRAEQIIRETLALPENMPITDAHARRAALSAWLCYLRQNVGSCFATAPAIIVQMETPQQFLKDLNELMNTGRLKRTFSGVEYAVPLSISWGAGDLKRTVAAGLDLALSPGLMAAFEAIGLIDQKLPLKQKVEVSKQLTRSALEGLESPVTNAESIIRFLLFARLKITEKDLQEYENRPQGMSLMAIASVSSKSQACAKFHTQLEAAHNRFKALADNALLKAWEFTIASFAETKADFARWNLYSSLGLSPQEKQGIGEAIYAVLQRKLDQANEKVREYQFEYEQVYTQVKYVEARMQRAATEKEINQLKGEYQTKLHEFFMIEEMRNGASDKAKSIAALFDTLIDAFDELFPHYFQEVYDADMHEVAVNQYDDSPAGFRLLYKYGRANTSQWTFIYSPNGFVEALSAFFIATEVELASREEFSGVQQELSEIITAIVTHVKTKEFLESAFHRMASAHQTRMIKDPLEHLDLIEKKPWAYTSGGGMGSLVSCYFKLEQPPAEVARWVENPMELLVFLADTLKQIPPKLTESYKSGHKGMLIHSPTHAFQLKPGIFPFREAWQNEAFSYTWIRDQLVKPMENALELIFLDESMMSYLVQKLAPLVPENYRYYFTKSFGTIRGTMSPMEFRRHLVETMDKERGLKTGGMAVLREEEIDSLLYKSLPLFPIYQMGDKLKELFKKVPGIDGEEVMRIWEALPSPVGMETVGSSDMLQNIAKGLICLHLGVTSTPQNYHQLVTHAARKCDFALAKPIIFGDSNWVRDDFGFLINPGTGKLDLWRFDNIAATGFPLTAWKQWLDGSRRDRNWGIYTRPYEYQA